MTSRLRIVGLSLALLVTTATSVAQADRLRNVQPGQALPGFAAAALDGSRVAFDGQGGQVLVLVYLSAAQQRSESAMAAAQRVVDALQQPKVRLVFMTSDTGQADYFGKLREQLAIQAPVVLDADRVYYGQVGLIALPTTIVSTPTGELQHVMASWTRDYEHRLGLYCRHALGELDDAGLAEQLAAEPVKRDDEHAKAGRHRAVAAALRAKGKYDEAVGELEQALALDPTATATAVDLVEVLVEAGRLDEAEQRLGVLEGAAAARGVAEVRGLVLLKRGRLDEAERVLKEALQLNPDPTRTLYYLGQVYEQKGDYPAATKHYRDALQRALHAP